MPFFRFSRQLCTRPFSRHFFRALCVCRPLPEVVVILWLFSWTLCFLCHENEFRHCLCWSSSSHTTITGHSVKEIAKFFNQTVRWVNKWSKREWFENKPRSGRRSVLTNAARKSIEKAKYKRTNSTRKTANNIQQKSIEVSSITVWRYMTRKGWKAFKRKKIPLLSEKQTKARLNFAKKHARLTAKDWDNFLFRDECPKSFPVP